MVAGIVEDFVIRDEIRSVDEIDEGPEMGDLVF
jgi:hypothetical protein